MNNDKSVTVIVCDKVKAAYEADYKNWLKNVSEKSRLFKGFIELEIIQPENRTVNVLEYHIIYRFDSYQNLRNWEKSKFLLENIVVAKEFFDTETKVQYLEGMKIFFDKQNQEHLAKNPPYWKQVVLSSAVVFPLILFSNWFLTFVPAEYFYSSYIQMLVSITIVSALMVYPAMPYASRWLGKWLYK